MVVVDKIEGFLEKDIKMLGFDLWGIETFGNGKAKTLRIFIDSIGSVTLDDCARVSRHVGALLDVKELTESNYNLEVSSPGLDRKFFKDTQYCNYIGSNIKVRYKDSYNKPLSIEDRKQFDVEHSEWGSNSGVAETASPGEDLPF